MAASPSCLPVLLPDSAHLSVESVRRTEGAIVIGACSTGETATCPACGFRSCRVHSQYGRTLRDLSYQGARVEIRPSARSRVRNPDRKSTRLNSSHLGIS